MKSPNKQNIRNFLKDIGIKNIYWNIRHPMFNAFVYILFEKRKPIYIGKTVNILKRLGMHCNDKEFDSFYYFEPPDKGFLQDISVLESFLIREFKPALNKDFNSQHDRTENV